MNRSKVGGSKDKSIFSPYETFLALIICIKNFMIL